MKVEEGEVVHSSQVCNTQLGLMGKITVRVGSCTNRQTLPFRSCCGLFSGLSGCEGGWQECWSGYCVEGTNVLAPPASKKPEKIQKYLKLGQSKQQQRDGRQSVWFKREPKSKKWMCYEKWCWDAADKKTGVATLTPNFTERAPLVNICSLAHWLKHKLSAWNDSSFLFWCLMLM